MNPGVHGDGACDGNNGRMARGIAVAQGGTLTVTSAPDAGTTFHLSVPEQQ
jgi:ribonuclease HI